MGKENQRAADSQSRRWIEAARWGGNRGAQETPQEYYDAHSGQVMVRDGITFRPQTEEEKEKKPYASG